MSDSELTSEHGTEKVPEKSDVLHRFPIRLKRDRGVWFFNTREPAVLTVLESTIHITKCSRDSFSASGPIYLSLKSVTVEAPTRDSSEIRLIQDRRKSTSRIAVTLWCEAVSRAKVLAAIFRARAKKRQSVKRKPTFEDSSFRTWNICAIKRTSGAVINRMFRIVPGTVDICSESPDGIGPISLYSIADINSVLYSPSEEEATVIFNGGRRYRVWRGSHVWAFLMAVQERARAKLAVELIISQNLGDSVRKRREDIDLAHLAGTDIDSLESLCCIEAIRIRGNPDKTDRLVILQVGSNFFLERDSVNQNAVTVFAPEDILRVSRTNVQRKGSCRSCDSENLLIEFSDGRIRNYESVEASCLLATLYFIRERRGIAKLDVTVNDENDNIAIPEKRLVMDREIAFRNGDGASAIWEQVPPLAHDIDTYAESLHSFIEQVSHTLRAGNTQSLTNCYIKVQELRLALERFNFLVPLARYRNDSTRTLVGLFPLIQEIHTISTSSKDDRRRRTSESNNNGLEYEDVITSLTVPLLGALSRSLAAHPNLENALRRPRLCKMILDFILSDDLGVSTAGLHVLSALCAPSKSVQILEDTESTSVFEMFSKEGERLLKALRKHTEACDFYSAAELINALHRGLGLYQKNDIKVFQQFKQQFRSLWYTFYLLSRSKSPILALRATQLLEKACSGGSSIEWDLDDASSGRPSHRTGDKVIDDPRTQSFYPRVAALVRARGGLLWHLLFALNTRIARECVSDPKSFGYRLLDEFRTEQERASTSLLSTLSSSDPRTVLLLRRIFPKEVLYRCRVGSPDPTAMRINDSNNLNDIMIDAKECIHLLRGDVIDPELMWDQRTRTYLFQAVTRQLEEIDQKHWFGGKQGANQEQTRHQHCSDEVLVWDDFDFTLDYNDVLRGELPLGDGLFARPLIDNQLCPSWQLRFPQRSLQSAFSVYAAGESFESRTTALTAVKAIVTRHLFDLGDMGSYVRAFIACLCDGHRTSWQERALIAEILNSSCRGERNMRTMINSEIVNTLSRILAVACAVDPVQRVETAEEAQKSSTDLMLNYRSGYFAGKDDQTQEEAWATAKSLLNLMFAMSTFSTQDDAAIRCLESFGEQNERTPRPSRTQRILVEEKPFCFIAQAILSSSEEVYRCALLVIHRLIPFLDPELIRVSGMCMFILSRRLNSHIMTASFLLARCHSIREDVLDGLLPSQLILLLKNLGPVAFSRIYSSEMRRPDLVWSPESRECLSSTLSEELSDFLQERTRNPFTLYADMAKVSQRKISVVFPDVSSRLVCGGLFADILAEDCYSNEWPVESPVLVASDAFDLLRIRRTSKDTFILLRVQWKMAQRFGAEVLVAALECLSSSGLQLYVDMLMSILKQYNGTDLELFDMMHMILTLIELAVVGPLDLVSKTLSSEDNVAGSESHTSADNLFLSNESFTATKEGAEVGECMEKDASDEVDIRASISSRSGSNNLHVDNIRLARASFANSRKYFFEANGLQTIGVAIEVLLAKHSLSIEKILTTYSKRTYIPSMLPGAGSFSFEGRRLRSSSSMSIPNISAPGRILEAVRMCLNILNHVVPCSNPLSYQSENIFSAVDSSLFVLWACSGPSSDLDQGNNRFDVADSAFKLLGLICSPEYLDIAKYAFEQGLAMCMLQLCLSYRVMDSSRSEVSGPVGDKVEDWRRSSLQAREIEITMKNWLAISAAEILIVLRNLQDLEMIQGLERLLGKLSRYLQSRDRQQVREGQQVASVRFLHALHTDHLHPFLIWNAETRHELKVLCSRVRDSFLRSPFSRNRTAVMLPTIFSSFQYACHSKEVLVNGVFLRVYNHSIQAKHSDVPSFLVGLFSELDAIVIPDKSGTSLIARDASLAHKAEVILEAICNLMSRQHGWEKILMDTGRFDTSFLVLEKGIGSTRMRALEVIKLAAQEPIIADSLAERRFALTLYNLAFMSIDRQLRERCLGLLITLCANSTPFATQLLSMGALVSFVQVLAEGDPRSAVRVRAVEAIGTLGTEPTIGKIVRKRLLRILPAKLAAAVSEGQLAVGSNAAGTDSIKLFDGFSNAPDLLWNEGMRQELMAVIIDSTNAMRLNLENNANAKFDEKDEFTVEYSQTKNRPLFQGILLDELLGQLAWPWPFSTTRADFVCSMIDWMCISDSVPLQTESAGMLLIASFAAVYDEVELSGAVLSRLDKIAVLGAKILKTVEAVEASVYCISILFDKMIENAIEIRSPVFWSAVVMLLTNKRSIWKIRLPALHMCLAACYLDKPGSSAAFVEMKACTAIANRLIHTSRIDEEDEEDEEVDSSSSLHTYGEEFRLLMLLVGLLSSHDEQMLNEFKQILDGDLLATAMSASAASQEAGENIWMPLDSRGIFDLVDREVFTAPTVMETEVQKESEEENQEEKEVEAGQEKGMAAEEGGGSDEVEENDETVEEEKSTAESIVENEIEKWKAELAASKFEEKLDAVSLHTSTRRSRPVSFREAQKSVDSIQSIMEPMNSAQWSLDLPVLSVAGIDDGMASMLESASTRLTKETKSSSEADQGGDYASWAGSSAHASAALRTSTSKNDI